MLYHLDIESVFPSHGSKKGGTTLTITGKFFGKDADKIKVRVGGVECKVQSVVDDTIECVTGIESDTQPEFYLGMNRHCIILTH